MEGHSDQGRLGFGSDRVCHGDGLPCAHLRFHVFEVFIDAHHSLGNVTASNSERPTELTDKATNTATSTFHTDRGSHIITNVSTNADASINTD